MHLHAYIQSLIEAVKKVQGFSLECFLRVLLVEIIAGLFFRRPSQTSSTTVLTRSLSTWAPFRHALVQTSRFSSLYL